MHWDESMNLVRPRHKFFIANLVDIDHWVPSMSL